MQLSRVAEALGCTLNDEHASLEVSGIAQPEDAAESDVVFLADPRLLHTVAASSARYAIVKPGTELPGKILLEVADPYLGYARVAQLFEDRTPLFDGPRHSTAQIDSTATVDPSAHVGPGTVVGAGCTIGAGTIIGANCVVENNCTVGNNCRIDSGAIIRRACRLGSRVIVQSGAVIGSEGFGNAMDGPRFVRIPCFGDVVIEDDVEIGANVTIDRGNFASTVIKRGARIDNLVHIAHNVTIGENSALAAQVGISGSTSLGNSVMVGGQAGFVGHIHIGDGAFVGAQAGVSKGVEKGAKVTGYPARDFMTQRRIDAALAELPHLLKAFKRLTKRLDGNFPAGRD